MDLDFALALADVRLLQTSGLLRQLMDENPERRAGLGESLEAVRAAREILKSLKAQA